MYTIRLTANMKDSSKEGYKSCIEAFDGETGEWLGLINHFGNGLGPCYIIVQEERGVFASTAIGACQKFKRWMTEGLDRSFLLAPK